MSTIQTLRADRDPARVISFAAPAHADRAVAVAVEVGWMLATAGHRVLLVDAGRPGPGSRWPGVAAHLDLFPSVERFRLEPEERALASLGGTAVVRHLLPEPATQLDVLLPDPHPAGPVHPAEVRAAIDRRFPYEYVLVSTSLDRWLAEPELFGTISDLAVACVSAAGSAAQQAGEAMRRLRAISGGLDLIGVACHPVGGDPAQLAARRGAIRRALAPPEDPDSPPPVVELVDRRWPPDRPVLPVLLDQPATAEQSTGYEQLLAAVTAGAAAAPKVSVAVRRRYQRRAAGVTHVEPDRIWVCYPPDQRGWAEWVVGELSRAGAVAACLAGPPDPDDTTDATAFVLLGPADTLPGPVRQWLAAHFDRSAVAAGPEAFQVRLRGAAAARGGDASYPAAPLDLSAADEATARATLLAPFILTPPADPAEAATVAGTRPARFPGRPAAPIANPPPPGRDFVGRERELARLRGGLLDQPVQLITGPAAVGKSEIARTYASRFAFDYDVVWWVPARDRPSIQASLSSLAARLGDAERGVGREPARVLSRRLGPTDGSQRWLLVYDDADDPAVLSDLLPVGDNVHVVITSRQVFDLVAAPPIAVAVMSPGTGARLLTRRIEGLSREDAEGLVDRFGGEPLALRLVASALRERMARLRGPGRAGSSLAGEAVRSYLATLADSPARGTASALRATVEVLRGSGPHGMLALALARMCVYLSPDGVSLDLLRTTAMTDALAGLVDELARDRLVADVAVIDAVVWLGARSGLLDVDWGSDNRLRVHRVVQQELAGLTSAGELRRCQQAVITGLARDTPNDAELEVAAHHDRLHELRRHLAASGALESDDRAARRWVLSQIQYAARFGDAAARREALATAEAVVRRWALDPERDLDLRLRLAAEQARLHHELGEYDSAVEVQARVQEQLRQRLGVDHLRTLLACRSAARYLRGVGRFTDAQVQDHVAYQGLARLLGRGHPNTLRAANNLAFSASLVGDVEDAARLQREILVRLVADTGWERDNVWIYATNLGSYLRDLGQYPEARRILEDALHGVRSGGQTTAAQQLELRIIRNLAQIHRWQGRHHLALRDHREALGRYLDLLGPEHPDTLAARLAVAADRAAEGSAEAAVADATAAYEGLGRTLPGGHPYRYLCQLVLGATQLAAHQADAARESADQAWRGLTDRLGGLHPWTLAAAANRLNALAVTEPTDAVAAQYQALADTCEEYLTPTHPYSQVISANRSAVEKPDQASLRPLIVDVPSV